MLCTAASTSTQSNYETHSQTVVIEYRGQSAYTENENAEAKYNTRTYPLGTKVSKGYLGPWGYSIYLGQTAFLLVRLVS